MVRFRAWGLENGLAVTISEDQIEAWVRRAARVGCHQAEVIRDGMIVRTILLG